MSTRDVSKLVDASSDWLGLTVTVAGLGVAGYAAATALVDVGANVTVLDPADTQTLRERAEIVEVLGGVVRLGCSDGPDSEAEVFVVSPGIKPSSDLIVDAQHRGITVWGELELAWRLRPRDNPAPWLCITGTNGKTTATLMLAAMLAADGRSVAAAGNVGDSLIDAVRHPGLDVIAVEVSATQMPFVTSMSPYAAVCLNLAPDHLDFFTSMRDYADNKALVYRNTQVVCVYNVEDPVTEQMVIEADVVEGCRAVGFTLRAPSIGMVGVVDDLLVDRAFIDDRATHGQELATISDVPVDAPAYIANALAAAAMARAIGVSPASIRAGLQTFAPAPHRIALVGEVGGVRFVNDSKATNAHAATTSLGAFESVVWIAGGLAKGQSFDELIERVATRLRGVVLMGTDREIIRRSLELHAPLVPIMEVASRDPDAMTEVVRLAHRLAQPADTVLLAPACASWDMFANYGDRGDRFTRAVRELVAEES